MAVTVNSIIDRAEIILQDTTNVRWPTTELIDWLNAGQYEIVFLKPDVYVKNESIALALGSKQSIPASGILLIDVTRNMGVTAGAEADAGNAITRVSRTILDTQVPDWTSSTASPTVNHFVFDNRDLKTFYVYPKSTGTNYVEIIYSTVPATVTAGDDIIIADIYSNVLLDYVLYRAYSKDAEYSTNEQRAAAYYKLFQNALGAKDLVESSVEPDFFRKTTRSKEE